MNKFRFWFNNARPISLPQSLLPALTAVALTVGQGTFSVAAALASIIGVVFLHLGLNLMDDWYDYKARQRLVRRSPPKVFAEE